jgi:hypothetical protein
MADLLPIHAVYDGTTVRAYFRTSDVYGETGGLGQKVGIKKVKLTDLTGAEEILAIKEALRVSLLSRIHIRYKKADGKKAAAKILVRTSLLSLVFGDVATDKLTGVTYSVNGTNKGTIETVGTGRRAHFSH